MSWPGPEKAMPTLETPIRWSARANGAVITVTMRSATVSACALSLQIHAQHHELVATDSRVRLPVACCRALIGRDRRRRAS